MERGVIGEHHETPYTYIPDIGTHPPGVALPNTAWFRLSSSEVSAPVAPKVASQRRR